MKDENVKVKGLMSDDAIKEHASLVAMGVRPLSIVGTVRKDFEDMGHVHDKLQNTAAYRVGYIGRNVIPIYVETYDGLVDVGFAARGWIADTLHWLNNAEIPTRHRRRILGMMQGQSVDAIAAEHEVSGQKTILYEEPTVRCDHDQRT